MTLFWQAPPEGQVSSTPREVDTVLYKATSEGQVPFTQEEMEIWEADLVKARAEREAKAKTQYQRDRAEEYPPIVDYIDGIVKGDQAQVQAYIDACLAVKVKYPKPDAA